VFHVCEIGRIGHSFTIAIIVGRGGKNGGGAVLKIVRLIWNVFHDRYSFISGCVKVS
jgi:hypothetical protein